MSVRLDWDGKPTEIERLNLPFQTVETINESRATRERDAGSLLRSDAAELSTRNRLIWGDNKLVMSSLMREYAGQIKLIYIDPPFDTGTDFSFRVAVGDASVSKMPSILEEHAYRDTWGQGAASYFSMVYERLVFLHELLADDGSLYLHCAPNVSHALKLICDEVFGPENFRNEISWKRSSAKNDPQRYGRSHEVLLFFTKGENYTWNVQHTAFEQDYVEQNYRYVEEGTGRRYRRDNLTAAKAGGDVDYEWHGARPYKGRHWAYSRDKMDKMLEEGRIEFRSTGMPVFKRYLDEQPGVPLQDIWTDIRLHTGSNERVGYATQKPEALLERVLSASSNPGDLVADLFCGSGTTLVSAEKLGRNWIGCDLGRFAIHTTRKRLLNITDCRPFEIQNLGAYERQRWQQAAGNDALRAYFDTILAFYRAETVEGFLSLHGRKANRMVHVGATDAPVTIDECEEVMDEMADNGVEAADVLGWEWEMGLHDTIPESARRRGLDLQLRQIPREVMEREVTEADAVRFFELAHVDLDVKRNGMEAAVVLKDFAIPSEDLIPAKVREEISSWSDLIDYWSIDFDHRDETFHNQWQAYRTREEPKLTTQSDWHEYPQPGTYAIVVKIIDIFGNDTTKLAEVKIK